MLKFDSIKDFEDKFNILRDLYIQIRIVNPLTKLIISTIPKSDNLTNTFCYNIWPDSRICENCISAQAYNKNHTAIKLAGKYKEIYVVTAVPIIINNENLVAELVQNLTDNNELLSENYPDDSISFLQSLSIKINQLLISDELTKLYNRRYIDTQLPSVLANASRFDHPVSLIFADIDYFKKVNDKYGHRVGDIVLQKISKLFKKQIHYNNSWVARYGGEEFLICLYEINYEEAKAIAEQLRKKIMKKNFAIDDFNFSITCSFGVKTLHGEECAINISEFIALADKNLYQAKAEGRNKVI